MESGKRKIGNMWPSATFVYSTKKFAKALML